MANLPYKDIDGTTTKYVKATGVGSDADPYVTIRAGTTADGGDVTQGAIADAAATTDGGSFSLIALIKRLLGKFPATLGQKASTASMAVVVASDQSAIPVAGTFFQATQPVSSAALPLPAGAATSANQTATNVLVTSLDTKAPALGQALVGASVPVVLPATQLTSLTPPAAITGFALEATLVAQSAKLPATLGAKTSAASLGVVLASDQATLNVNLAQRLDATNDSINIGKINGTLPDAEFTILASAARSATLSIDLVRPVGARGLVIWFDVTAVPGADTVTLSLIGRDVLTTGKTKTIAGFTAIAAATTALYQVYPSGSLSGSYTQSVAAALPINVRATITHSAATSFTYAIGGCWVS